MPKITNINRVNAVIKYNSSLIVLKLFGIVKSIIFGMLVKCKNKDKCTFKFFKIKSPSIKYSESINCFKNDFFR